MPTYHRFWGDEQERFLPPRPQLSESVGEHSLRRSKPVTFQFGVQLVRKNHAFAQSIYIVSYVGIEGGLPSLRTARTVSHSPRLQLERSPVLPVGQHNRFCQSSGVLLKGPQSSRPCWMPSGTLRTLLAPRGGVLSSRRRRSSPAIRVSVVRLESQSAGLGADHWITASQCRKGNVICASVRSRTPFQTA